MTRIAGKLLILLALLTMPAGMSWIGASASAHSHGSAGDGSAAMTMEHCPESVPTADVESGIAPCNMACASALPALDAPIAVDLAKPDCPLAVTEVSRLNGLEPDIATPPPRLS